MRLYTQGQELVSALDYSLNKENGQVATLQHGR